MDAAIWKISCCVTGEATLPQGYHARNGKFLFDPEYISNQVDNTNERAKSISQMRDQDISARSGIRSTRRVKEQSRLASGRFAFSTTDSAVSDAYLPCSNGHAVPVQTWIVQCWRCLARSARSVHRNCCQTWPMHPKSRCRKPQTTVDPPPWLALRRRNAGAKTRNQNHGGGAADTGRKDQSATLECLARPNRRASSGTKQGLLLRTVAQRFIATQASQVTPHTFALVGGHAKFPTQRHLEPQVPCPLRSGRCQRGQFTASNHEITANAARVQVAPECSKLSAQQTGNERELELALSRARTVCLELATRHGRAAKRGQVEKGEHGAKNV